MDYLYQNINCFVQQIELSKYLFYLNVDQLLGKQVMNSSYLICLFHKKTLLNPFMYHIINELEARQSTHNLTSCLRHSVVLFSLCIQFCVLKALCKQYIKLNITCPKPQLTTSYRLIYVDCLICGLIKSIPKFNF